MLIKDSFAHGIDVSHYRGEIDWHAVRDDNIVFGIAKATEGSSFIDNKFDANWSGMRRARLVRGAFHFYRPAIDPEEQAAHFLRLVGNILHPSDLPPILDVEVFPEAVRKEFEAQKIGTRKRRLQTWLTLVEEATGRVPIIYTSLLSWQLALENTTEFTRYPLWIAHYEVKDPSIPAGNWGGGGWRMWQYTSKGAVAGVNGGKPPVDMNLYFGPPEDLHGWVSFDGQRPLPPEMTNGEMLEAFALAASKLGVTAKSLLEKTKLAYMGEPASNRPRPYDGPAVSEMKLSSGEKAALQDALRRLAERPPNGSLAGFTHQEVINLFYKAAQLVGLPGWTLIELAGLVYIANDRFAYYDGPAVMQMTGLDDEQKAALFGVLGLEWKDVGSEPDPTPAPEPEPDPEPEKTYPYSGLTNQQMINAFYKAASALGWHGWDMIELAGLERMAENREALYDGPSVTEMQVFNDQHKAILSEMLGFPLDQNPSPATYPGMVNQDMINLFYRAAGKMNQLGWTWIHRAGLQGMAASREVRYQLYRGPRIADMPNLTAEEKDSLQRELDALRSPPPA